MIDWAGSGWAVAALALVTALLFGGLLQLRRRVADLSRRTRRLDEQAGQWAAGGEQQLRRLRGELAQERRAANRRQRTLLRALERDRAATEASLARLTNRLVRGQRDQTREVEALLQLFADLEPRAPMPPSGHWALNPTDLLQLWAVVEQRRPALVLELGSGTSSVWLGYAVERLGGRLVSVDHDPAYAEQTRAQLRRHGLDQVAEVRDAPLRKVVVAGEHFRWYEPKVFADMSDVELLVVDGPPGATGPLARYPALPLLVDRLAPAVAVLLDDADRADEREILRRWQEQVPRLRREPATLGHLAVLTRQPPPEHRG